MIKAAITFVAAAWLCGAAPAEACSCSGLPPTCQGVWLADAVFLGRVLDITGVKNEPGATYRFLHSRRVTLEVLEPFRGGSLLVASDGSATVDVFTGQGSGDCGIPFKKGDSYLVFAKVAKDEPTRLQTGLCDRTRELARAEDDLPYLRSLAKLSSPAAAPRGGRVYGYVELSDPQLSRPPMGAPPPERKRLADVPITLTEEGGAGVTKTTSTNASGQYEFTDLAPGKYRVEPTLPGIYHHYNVSAPLGGELRDARGCSEVILHVVHDGRISGRLLGAQGAPVANMTIALLDADDPDSPYRVVSILRALTDANGAFEVTKVPPGRYFAAINVDRDVRTRELLKPRILYPGVTRTGDATTIDVGPGERVKLADWSLPR